MFVSSTLEELAAERAAARRAVEELRFIPVLFELGARPHPPRALYRAYLEQSHVFVGIYWQRYGWVAPGMEISGLEDEHELAAGTGIPKLVYVKRPAGERDPRLQRMLERVAASGVSYRGFETPDELADLLRDDLALLVSERFAREAPTVAGGHVAIPAPVSSFVGRAQDLAAVEELLRRRDVRLVTLTGAGGIGKTRLAFEAARGVVDAFSHGVVAVLLASLTDSEEVLPAVAEALGVTMGADTSVAESLREHLAAREVLLVLDNMEHVLAAAPAVGDLLAGAAGVTVLATSRARLDVSGEHVFRVSPLPLPTAGERDPDAIRRSDSVRLFTTRAAAAGWTTDDADLEIVSAIVRALDGLPLAIELAAAQARLVPAELIHARLRRRLDLAGGPRDADERHRTLRSTIGWSYDLLDEPARRFLAALAVFSGGFSIDAAGAVVDRGVDVEELLASLVDASLVTTGPSPVTGVRFGMLETIREYAGEKLEELGLTAETVARHLAYFAQLADDAADAPPEERGAARGRLDEERENLRVALQEALRTNAAEAVRLAGALGTFFSQRGLNREGREIIARAPSPPLPRPRPGGALVHSSTGPGWPRSRTSSPRRIASRTRRSTSTAPSATIAGSACASTRSATRLPHARTPSARSRTTNGRSRRLRGPARITSDTSPRATSPPSSPTRAGSTRRVGSTAKRSRTSRRTASRIRPRSSSTGSASSRRTRATSRSHGSGSRRVRRSRGGTGTSACSPGR